MQTGDYCVIILNIRKSGPPLILLIDYMIMRQSVSFGNSYK